MRRKRKKKVVRLYGFDHLFHRRVKRVQLGLHKIAKEKGMMDPRDITFGNTKELFMSADKFKNRGDGKGNRK